MSVNIKSNIFMIKMLIRKEGKIVKIRKATFHKDTDRGTDYVTWDDTITTRALMSNVSGWMEMVYPYGKAYEGDYLCIFNPKDAIDVHDQIIYDDMFFKITERNPREDFLEIVIERI